MRHRQRHIQVGRQLPAPGRLPDDVGQACKPLLEGLLLALEDRARVLHELALVEHDLEDPAPVHVFHQLLQHEIGHIAQLAQRIVGFDAQRRAQGLHRQLDALAHGGEHIGLVAEMPVDGAARDTGRLRDVG